MENQSSNSIVKLLRPFILYETTRSKTASAYHQSRDYVKSQLSLSPGVGARNRYRHLIIHLPSSPGYIYCFTVGRLRATSGYGRLRATAKRLRRSSYGDKVDWDCFIGSSGEQTNIDFTFLVFIRNHNLCWPFLCLNTKQWTANTVSRKWLNTHEIWKTKL